MKLLLLALASSALFAIDCVDFSGTYSGKCKLDGKEYGTNLDIKQTGCEKMDIGSETIQNGQSLGKSKSTLEIGRKIPINNTTSDFEVKGSYEAQWAPAAGKSDTLGLNQEATVFKEGKETSTTKGTTEMKLDTSTKVLTLNSHVEFTGSSNTTKVHMTCELK